jgi:hypothetical protein
MGHTPSLPAAEAAANPLFLAQSNRHHSHANGVDSGIFIVKLGLAFHARRL